MSTVIAMTSPRRDSTDRERFDVRWTPEGGVPRAVIFESRNSDWVRATFEWSGERWRELERERVTEVGRFGDGCEFVGPDSPHLAGGSDDG